MEKPSANVSFDVETINQIPIIPSLLEVVCRTTGMGFAAVARVTEDRWIACSVRDEISFGLPAGGELKLETTICNEIRLSHQAVIIDDVDQDEFFRDHHTPALYGFKSYISIPIFRRDKSFFGTLCAVDPSPAKLNRPEIIGMFTLFADLISFHLGVVDELRSTQNIITEGNKNTELREQFIAILGHDLRNPVGAIANSADLLRLLTQDPEIVSIASVIKNSSNRMISLIKNMLDFASGRMGGGIQLTLQPNINVEKLLNEVITETRLIWPDKAVVTHFNITSPVTADANRIAQLFSNLLRNAFTYSKHNTAVTVSANTTDGNFSLAVCNEGEPIAEEITNRLFQPFVRGQVNKGQEGLGLGLYIASEIAQAHKGNLQVISDSSEIRFTLSIPLKTTAPTTVTSQPAA